MRFALLLLALPLAAQSWSDIHVREGDTVFRLLHGETVLSQLPSVPAPPSSIGPTVSFSAQGSAVLQTLTGKRIAGVGIHEVLICSPDGAPVRGGAVYQLAISHGIEPISPPLARALFRTTVQRNWRNTVLRGGAYASLGIPVLGQAGVISMTSKWIISLLSGHVVFDSLQSDLRAQLPDPEPLLSTLLDPEGIVQFAGNCRESKMVTRFNKSAVSGTFPLY